MSDNIQFSDNVYLFYDIQIHREMIIISNLDTTFTQLKHTRIDTFWNIKTPLHTFSNMFSHTYT